MKKVIRKVLEESVDKLDGAHMRAVGVDARSDEALEAKRRVEDMIAGAQLPATDADETADTSDATEGGDAE